jgi:hypothetical protein
MTIRRLVRYVTIRRMSRESSNPNRHLIDVLDCDLAREHQPEDPLLDFQPVDVETVMNVRSPIEGERACDELRARGIKCDCVEPTTPNIPGGYGFSSSFQVVVAQEDAESARSILRSWRGRGST